MLTIYRTDYKPYPFELKKTFLQFNIDVENTYVYSNFHVSKKIGYYEKNMVLNGENLELIDILINGNKLKKHEYILEEHRLIILNIIFNEFILEIYSKNHPNKNFSMNGLYISQGVFFTQCEPESFRKICWFPDRPDVLSVYTVKIIASNKYNTLLSNGNLVSIKLKNNKKEVIWHDPFPKPCYLFAMVVGKLHFIEKNIQTKSGKNVLLQIYSEKKYIKDTKWAMKSLIYAIRWDEKIYGLELDLNRFMIIAALDFNMGAMENKGLNIFNYSYILCNKNISTDKDYINVTSVIGHEYFHNWSGNRVTCRDWFQLSLKEGLTVFREQEFISDMMMLNSPKAFKQSAKMVKRINDVILLRDLQFAEDASSMAHAIRPESYTEISNFYTSTIYEKSAEIIRMQYNLLGMKKFFIGIKEYFRKYDGFAITCEDFIDTMSLYSNCKDYFKVIKNWYSQAGTPVVHVDISYEEDKKICRVHLIQTCSIVRSEKNIKNFVKKPFFIPLSIGLISDNGINLKLSSLDSDIEISKDNQTATLYLVEKQKSWNFCNILHKPIPSLLRSFSAPIIVNYHYTEHDLIMLLMYDQDYFARWDAGQNLATKYILEIYNQKHFNLNDEYVSAIRKIIKSNEIDSEYKAKLLTIPNEKYLMQKCKILDPIQLIKSREIFIKSLAKKLFSDFIDIIDMYDNSCIKNNFSFSNIGKHSLLNTSLNYLISIESDYVEKIVINKYLYENNITIKINALSLIENFGKKHISEKLLEDFYKRYKYNHTIIDKWFAIQSSSRNRNIFDINKLTNHVDFNINNPNRVQSLIFNFCINNIRSFHKIDGSGYNFWMDYVIKLDAINQELSSSLTKIIGNWHILIPQLKNSIQKNLLALKDNSNLSNHVLEIINNLLNLSR